MLEIKNLTVEVQDKEILHDFSLNINSGEIKVLMGPNGTGKSTICKVLMHHPDYQITKGTIKYNGTIINDLTPTDIGKLGFFLLGQNPTEIEGITNAELLRNIIGEKTGEKVDIFKFQKKLADICNILDIPKEFIHKNINFNMSGGEKKKNELLHLFMLEPEFIILDEIDSGLDIDSLKIVGESLKKYYDTYHPTILIITHHAEILKHFSNYQVAIMKNGTVVQNGSQDLVELIEKEGFRASVIAESEQNE